jgi:hypothetical protein
MSAIEYERQLAEARDEEESQREIIASLVRAKDDAISQGKGDEAVLANEKLVAAQKQLVNSAIRIKACESKLNYYKKNSQEAAEIRKKIAGELWPQGAGLVTKMQSVLADLPNTIHGMDELNGTMQGLALQHEALTGESIAVPLILVPEDLRRLASVQLPSLPESLELRTRSELLREAQERERAIFKDRMSKQKSLVLPYLQSQGMVWPVCERCHQELVCMGGAVYAGSSSGDGPRDKAFRLQFRCENGPHNGSQGFIRIEAGPYSTAPLTDLEIDRER